MFNSNRIINQCQSGEDMKYQKFSEKHECTLRKLYSLPAAKRRFNTYQDFAKKWDDDVYENAIYKGEYMANQIGEMWLREIMFSINIGAHTCDFKEEMRLSGVLQ